MKRYKILRENNHTNEKQTNKQENRELQNSNSAEVKGAAQFKK